MSWQSETRSEPREPREPRSEPGSQAPRPEDRSGDVRSIGEVSEQTGLSARTVRYYEEMGLLPGVRRRSGGRRVYGADELERLRFIKRLKALGLSLAEIRELNAVHSIGGSTRQMLRRLDLLLGRKLADLAGRIEDLTSLRAEIGRYKDRIARRIDGSGAGGDA